MARLAYACVLTRNAETLAAFYRLVLQADPEWTGAYAEFPTGPSRLGVWAIEAYRELIGPAPGTEIEIGSGAVMLEFEVADVDAEYRRLQQVTEFKIEFVIPPTTMAWGNRSIYFRDPDGNLVNLFSHVGAH